MMETVFSLIESDRKEEAIRFIRRQLATQNEAFYEDLVCSLSLIVHQAADVVQELIPDLIVSLESADDLVRYSVILSLKEFVVTHSPLFLQFIKQGLQSQNPKVLDTMLHFLVFISEANPVQVNSFAGDVLPLMMNEEEFIRVKAGEFLKSISRIDQDALKIPLLEMSRATTNPAIIQSIETTLKSFMEISQLGPEELQQLEQSAKQSAMAACVGQIEGAELKRKYIQIRKEQAAIKHQLKLERMEEELLKRQQELQAREAELRDSEMKIKSEIIELQERIKELEAQEIESQATIAEIRAEISSKREELENVRREMEMKRLEEEKAEIIAHEAERIQKKLSALQEDDDDDENFQEIL